MLLKDLVGAFHFLYRSMAEGWREQARADRDATFVVEL